MNRLDKHVDFQGKPIAEESYNEINKMLFRVKDFQSVYNVSEGNFRYKDEEVWVKRSIDEVVEVAKNEIQKKNIEMTLTHGGDVPNSIKADPSKFKQVLLNLLL